jgi:hypothetical protein
MEPTTPEPTRACPFCGEQILAVAIKCKHCGSDLTTMPAEVSDADNLSEADVEPTPERVQIRTKMGRLKERLWRASRLREPGYPHFGGLAWAFSKAGLNALSAFTVLAVVVALSGVFVFVLLWVASMATCCVCPCLGSAMAAGSGGVGSGFFVWALWTWASGWGIAAILCCPSVVLALLSLRAKEASSAAVKSLVVDAMILVPAISVAVYLLGGG